MVGGILTEEILAAQEWCEAQSPQSPGGAEGASKAGGPALGPLGVEGCSLPLCPTLPIWRVVQRAVFPAPFFSSDVSATATLPRGDVSWSWLGGTEGGVEAAEALLLHPGALLCPYIVINDH